MHTPTKLKLGLIVPLRTYYSTTKLDIYCSYSILSISGFITEKSSLVVACWTANEWLPGSKKQEEG